VLKRKSWLTIVSCAVLCFISVGSAAQKFSDQGSVELGGAFSFASVSYESTPVNTVILSPTITIFPAKSLMVGPIFSWKNISGSGISYSEIDVGGRIGLIYPSGRNFIYFGTGYEVASSTEAGASNETMQGFPLFVGYKVRLQKQILLSIEPSIAYHFSQYRSATVVGVSVGVSGLLFK